ncbi:uncharacterized protein CIMG_03668 [Coccidioides immitis RS]|uniref:Uncharacterized protein n=1 Tax=Coccidioides immitis (strain RS) TaxID=246410 RepID=J3KBW3_COCIM|nr:uncharacterized protein CIMG_03668 [Coccidioides immitis RS]EAS32644.3 hypothetical protein CIMG_03668 [Coccidioides immitis RS]
MEQHAWLPDYISEANLFVHVNRGRGENCISVIRFMVVALPQSSVVTLCFGPRYMSWHSAMWNSAFGQVSIGRCVSRFRRDHPIEPHGQVIVASSATHTLGG